MKKTNNKRAFTLVEIMIATLLGALVLGGGFYVWSNANRTMVRTRLKMQLQSEADKISDSLSADFKAAKADSLPAKLEGSFTSIQFDRYAELEEGEKDTLSSRDKIISVEYTLSGNILTRKCGSIVKILSTNIESFELSKESSDEINDNSYKDAKLAVSLTLKSKIPGSSNLEEILRRRYSIVVREEYFDKMSGGRSDIFSLARKNNEILGTISSSGTSAYFTGADGDGLLDKETLKQMDEPQLQSLRKEQLQNMEDADEQLKDINDQIDDVDTGFHTILRFLNTDGEKSSEALKDELKSIKCKDELPENEADRASEKCAKIANSSSELADSMQQKFIDQAFGNDAVKNIAEALNYTSKDDEDSAEAKAKEALKTKASIQKRVLEMKISDTRMKDEIEKQANDASIPDNEKLKAGIEQYRSLTDEDIRKECIAAYGEGTLADQKIQEQKTERDAIIAAYDKCNIDDIDKSGDYETYEATCQIKNFAETKRDICLMKEVAIINRTNIDEALKEKK